MTGRLLRITLALFALTLAGRTPALPAAAQSYTFQNLGTLGGTTTNAFGINNLSQVVGASEIAAGAALGNATHAFLWDSGKLTDLGTLGGDYSFGFAINDKSQVVGTAELSLPQGAPVAALHAFLWENGKMADLGTLGGLGSQASGINDGGQVIGQTEIATGSTQQHAFLWENGKLTDLGTLGGRNSYAYAINDLGQVVGDAEIPGNAALHAFLWKDGQMTDLGTLGGSSSWAYAINNLGQAVGDSDIPGDAAFHAFVWENGKMTDLGTLGGTSSIAWGINNLGQVVGIANDPLQNSHAFFWDRTGGIKDLNSQLPPGSGWELRGASGANDAGEIVGQGSFKLDLLAYLLSPATGKSLTNDQVSKAGGAIELIRKDVMQVAAASNPGAFAHLTYRLSAAETRLANGNATAAMNLLQAFINQVSVLIGGSAGGPHLAPADGQRWIDEAQAVLAQLRS